jgi:hypothetical protein
MTLIVRRNFLTARHGVEASCALFREIQGVIIRSLLSVQVITKYRLKYRETSIYTTSFSFVPFLLSYAGHDHQ